MAVNARKVMPHGSRQGGEPVRVPVVGPGRSVPEVHDPEGLIALRQAFLAYRT